MCVLDHRVAVCDIIRALPHRKRVHSRMNVVDLLFVHTLLNTARIVCVLTHAVRECTIA